MSHICKRCGHCCLAPSGRPELWLSCDLSEDEKNQLRTERKKHKPLVVPACEMLYWDTEPICLVQELLGKKPGACKHYPLGRKCIREYILRKDNRNK